MTEPASLRRNIRNAVLRGEEPPPAAALARLPSYRWLVVGSACIGAFMGQLDASIAQLLLPRLEDVYDARLSTVSWVLIAYLLAMAGFLPIFGRLADIVGRKLFFSGGFLLFVSGALMCGFAPNLTVLIIGRVVQGIAAAMMSSNSVAIVVAAARPQERGKALGIQAAAQAAGLSLGPALGGFLLDAFDWRWVFWAIVPVALLGAVVSWFVVPKSVGVDPDARFDWTGAALLVPGLAALITTINQAHAWGLTSPAIIACAVATVVLLGLFARSQLRAAEPLVDPELFRRPGFAAGNVAAFFSYGMLFGLFFLMPFVLIRAYHDSAFEAGLRLMSVPIALSLAAPVSGSLSDRFGPRALMVGGMVIAVATLVVLSRVMDGSPDSLPWIMAALAVVGAGQGLFTAPNNASLMAAAPPHLTGEAGSLMNVSRSIGVSVGVAITAGLLSWRIAVLTGQGERTTGIAPDLLAQAGGTVLLVLAGFAALAGLISLLRAQPPRAAGATAALVE